MGAGRAGAVARRKALLVGQSLESAPEDLRRGVGRVPALSCNTVADAIIVARPKSHSFTVVQTPAGCSV